MPGSRWLALAFVAVLAVLAVGCTSDDPTVPSADATTTPSPTPTPEPKCPLTGEDPATAALLERPAIAVKIENNSVAYPLSGLADAEIVYEELVEGGITRFLALFHCTDTDKAGPVRSSREIDPAVMKPITRILAAAGGNAIVRRTLAEAGLVLVDEDTPGGALGRIPRSDATFEHTLYANTKTVRKVGRVEFDKPPPEHVFAFGELEGKAKKARSVEMNFGGAATIEYRWNGKGWQRLDGGSPLPVEGGEIVVANVLIELHTINFSDTIVDVAGNPSIVFADERGKGKAILLRDGKAIKGTWSRRDEGEPAVFETRSGDEMVFAPGVTWVELLPDEKGEIKGSFTISKKPA